MDALTVKSQLWIFTVRYPTDADVLPNSGRTAIVGPARYSTVEAALDLAKLPEDARVQIRTSEIVRRFIEGRIDLLLGGYHYSAHAGDWWVVCIGSVQEVVDL